MNTLIQASIQKAISYQEYNKLVQQLVVDKKTTGDEQTEERIAFTKLNASRMRRLDKTLTLTDEAIQSFNSIQMKQTWLVLLESWCADGAQTAPVLNKIAEEAPFIDLKILLRDDSVELMNRFLTNGTQSIPRLLIVDQDNTILNTWGSRSKAATQLVTAYKKEHGKIDDTFKKDLQLWYNKDQGRAIIKDILEIESAIKSLEEHMI